MEKMTSETAPRVEPVVLEPELAKRINIACDNNDMVPQQGRLTWISRRLEELYGIKVSRETVRKWSAGEARPRPDKMKALAALLKVSESWLSLGTMAEPSPENMRRHSLSAESAVNLVAGMFGLNGANYAYPGPDDANVSHVHFYAISDGRQHSVYVATAQALKEGLRFNVSNKFEKLLVIGVVMRTPTHFDLYRITASALSKYGTRRGGHVELNVKDTGATLAVGSETLPRIESFNNLRRDVSEAA